MLIFFKECKINGRDTFFTLRDFSLIFDLHLNISSGEGFALECSLIDYWDKTFNKEKFIKCYKKNLIGFEKEKIIKDIVENMKCLYPLEKYIVIIGL